MRSTSIAAYHKSVEDGTITKRQREVYNYIKLSGPISGRSLGKAIPGAWKRLSELKAMGLVTDHKTTKDFVTGKIVHLWEVSNQSVISIPPQPKRKPYKELEAENRRLTEMLTEALYRSSAAYDMGYRQAKMEDGADPQDIY